MNNCKFKQMIGVAFGVILAWAFLANDPIAWAEIPLNPKATTHDDFKRMLARVNRKLYIDSYKEHGLRSPQWDPPAIQLLEEIYAPSIEGEAPNDHEKRMLEIGAKAIAAGCNDPWILCCYANRLAEAGRKDEAIQAYQRALEGFRKLHYPDRCRGIAAIRLARLLTDKDDYVTWSDAGIHALSDMVASKDFKPEERRVIWDNLRYLFPQMYLDQEFVLLSEIKRNPDADPWVAAVFEGAYETDVAWRIRGHGWASSVSPQQWEGFSRHIHRAREALVRAWNIAPECPEAASMMIGIAYSTNSSDAPLEECRLWFERAVSAEVDDPDAYESYSYAILPRWYGSHELMLKFGLECLETKRFDTYIPIWFANEVNSIVGESFDWTYVRRPEVQKGAEDLWAGYKNASKPKVTGDELRTQAFWLASHSENFHLGRQIVEDARTPDSMKKLIEPFSDKQYPIAEAWVLGGPLENDVKKAWTQADSDIQAAIASFQKLAATHKDDSNTTLFLERQISRLATQSELAKGGWVDFKFDEPMSSWFADLGIWKRIDDNTVEGVASKSAMLELPVSVGDSFEFEADVEVIKSTMSDGGPALILSTTEFEGKFSMVMRPALGQCQFVGSDGNQFDSQIVTIPKSNKCHMRFAVNRGVVNGWVDNQKVVRDLKLAEPNDHARFHVSLGSDATDYCDTFRFRNIRAHVLSQPQQPATAPAK